MLRSLFHGLYEVLDVPARVSLRVLVQLLGSPLGLLAGREARDRILTQLGEYQGQIRTPCRGAYESLIRVIHTLYEYAKSCSGSAGA